MNECVRATGEVCDGEDNDGDGLIDQDLYRAQSGSFLAPAPLRQWIAWNGRQYLVAWIDFAAGGASRRVRYQGLDASGEPLGSIRTVDDLPVSGPNEVSLRAHPDGFYLAYVKDSPPRTLYLVRVAADGTPSLPEPVWQSDSILDFRLGTEPGGPWFVVQSAVPSGDSGLTLVTQGSPPVGLPEGLRPGSLAVSDGSGIAVAWVESQDLLPSEDAAINPDRLRIAFGGTQTPIVELPAVTRAALAWRGGELGVAWLDESDASRPVIRFSRFDSRGVKLGDDHLITNRAAGLSTLRLVAGGREWGLAWLTSGLSWFARIDGEKGRIGAELALDSVDSSGGASWRKGTYELWAANLEVARLKCVDGPPVNAPDGGSSSTVLDAGSEEPTDGGFDGGTRLECPRDEPDGGTPIAGEVISLAGIPVPDVPVWVNGCTTRTDGQGRFQVGGVVGPYEVAAVVPFIGSPIAFSYSQVSSRSPKVRVVSVPPPGGFVTARVEGSYSGGASSARLLLFLPHVFSRRERLEGGSFSLEIPWPPWLSSAPAVMVERTAGGAFSGLTLLGELGPDDGGVVSFGDLPSTAVGSRVVAGALSEGFSSASVDLLLTQSETAVPISESTTSGSAFVLSVPSFDGGVAPPMHLLGTYRSEIGEAYTTVSLGADTTQIDLPAPPIPQPISPAPSATGVGTNPELTFSTVSGATGYVIRVQSFQGGFSIVAHAPSASYSIPDLSALGIVVQPGDIVSWEVGALFGPTYSEIIDGAVSPALLHAAEQPLRDGQGFSLSPSAFFRP